MSRWLLMRVLGLSPSHVQSAESGFCAPGADRISTWVAGAAESTQGCPAVDVLGAHCATGSAYSLLCSLVGSCPLREHAAAAAAAVAAAVAVAAGGSPFWEEVAAVVVHEAPPC